MWTSDGDNNTGANMAIYHYTFEVVPKKILDKNKITVPSFISQNEYEAINWWEGIELQSDILSEIAGILKRENSWSDGILQFGDLESTNIQLVYESNKVVEFNVRFDLRSIKKEMVQFILDIASKCDGIILSEENNLHYPFDPQFIEEIKQSSSFVFVRNYEEW